jgi:predicted nucleic acid-binding protein
MARIVLYDACVLYSAPVRDLLLRLALQDRFQARWSELIHEEWIRSVLAHRPDLSLESLVRCRQLMDEHVPDCLVTDCLVTGHEPIIADLDLPDPDDRHVLAAAIHSGASWIVTFNLADFPSTALEPYGIEAIHPDLFILDLLEEDFRAVLNAVREQREGLKQPSKTPDEHLATLERCDLRRTAARLRGHRHEI